MFHQKHVLCSAVADAIGAAGSSPVKTEEALRVGKPLTPQALDEFFDAIDHEKPSDEVRARMQVFTENILNMDAQSVAKLLRDFASKDRHEKLAAQAKTPEERDRILHSLYDVHRNRAKEARQIYGAVKYAGLKLDNMGWSSAYEHSRKVLAEKGIKWDASRVPTDAEQEKNAEKRTARRIAQEVKDAVQDLVNAGATIEPKHYSEIAERVQDSLNGRDAKRKAIQLVRREGPEMAELVNLALPEVIAVAKANGDKGLDDLEEALTKMSSASDIAKAAGKEVAEKEAAAQGTTQQQERKAA